MLRLPLWMALTAGLVLSALGCVDGESFTFPAPTTLAQSRLFAVECGGEVRVWALGREALAPIPLEACSGTARYFVAFYDADLETLGLEQGPVRFGDCPPEAELRCVEDHLPIPSQGDLYLSTRDPSGARSDWSNEDVSWPMSLGERVFPRATRCPDYVVHTIHTSDYDRFGGVFVEGERVILMGDVTARAPTQQRSSHLFDTTLTELRTRGIPATPTTSIAEYRGGQLDAVPSTGEVFVGVGSEDHFLRGQLARGLRRVPHVEAGRKTPRIALRKGSDARPILAIRDPDFPGETFFYEDGEWDSFDGTPQMVGTCAPFREEGQRGSMFWRNERELIAMPHAQSRDEVSVRTATNSPDGYWHIVDGEASWRRVEGHAPDDCLSLMVDLSPLGLMAITRDPQFFLLRSDRWERYEILRLNQMPYDDVIRSAVPMERGFAYTRQGGRFGYVVDRISCRELTLDETNLDEMMTNGRQVVVFGDAPKTEDEFPVPTGPASIHIIEFEDPSP